MRSDIIGTLLIASIFFTPLLLIIPGAQADDSCYWFGEDFEAMSLDPRLSLEGSWELVNVVGADGLMSTALHLIDGQLTWDDSLFDYGSTLRFDVKYGYADSWTFGFIDRNYEKCMGLEAPTWPYVSEHFYFGNNGSWPAGGYVLGGNSCDEAYGTEYAGTWLSGWHSWVMDNLNVGDQENVRIYYDGSLWDWFKMYAFQGEQIITGRGILIDNICMTPPLSIPASATSWGTLKAGWK